MKDIDPTYFDSIKNVHEYHITKPDRFLKTKFEDLFGDNVRDVIEVHYPTLAVVVACHDAKVRVIKLATKTVVELDTAHTKGVRQLDFTPFSGGALLSVGYEVFFNVWILDRVQSFPKTVN